MTTILTYALNALWQVPLIALAAAVIAPLAARIAPANPAAARHRVWVAALFLQVILPACTFSLPTLNHHLQPDSTNIRITFGPGVASPFRLSHAILLTLTFAYLATILYFFLRLLHGLIRTHLILRNATDLSLTPTLEQVAEQVTNLRIATSPAPSPSASLAPSSCSRRTFSPPRRPQTNSPSWPTSPPTSAATTSPSTSSIPLSPSPSPSIPRFGSRARASRNPAR
jgi:hypothetical protein